MVYKYTPSQASAYASGKGGPKTSQLKVYAKPDPKITAATAEELRVAEWRAANPDRMVMDESDPSTYRGVGSFAGKTMQFGSSGQLLKSVSGQPQAMTAVQSQVQIKSDALGRNLPTYETPVDQVKFTMMRDGMQVQDRQHTEMFREELGDAPLAYQLTKQVDVNIGTDTEPIYESQLRSELEEGDISLGARDLEATEETNLRFEAANRRVEAAMDIAFVVPESSKVENFDIKAPLIGGAQTVGPEYAQEGEFGVKAIYGKSGTRGVFDIIASKAEMSRNLERMGEIGVPGKGRITSRIESGQQKVRSFGEGLQSRIEGSEHMQASTKFLTTKALGAGMNVADLYSSAPRATEMAWKESKLIAPGAVILASGSTVGMVEAFARDPVQTGMELALIGKSMKMPGRGAKYVSKVNVPKVRFSEPTNIMIKVPEYYIQKTIPKAMPEVMNPLGGKAGFTPPQGGAPRISSLRSEGMASPAGTPKYKALNLGQPEFKSPARSQLEIYKGIAGESPRTARAIPKHPPVEVFRTKPQGETSYGSFSDVYMRTESAQAKGLMESLSQTHELKLSTAAFEGKSYTIVEPLEALSKAQVKSGSPLKAIKQQTSARQIGETYESKRAFSLKDRIRLEKSLELEKISMEMKTAGDAPKIVTEFAESKIVDTTATLGKGTRTAKQQYYDFMKSESGEYGGFSKLAKDPKRKIHVAERQGVDPRILNLDKLGVKSDLTTVKQTKAKFDTTKDTKLSDLNRLRVKEIPKAEVKFSEIAKSSEFTKFSGGVARRFDPKIMGYAKTSKVLGAGRSVKTTDKIDSLVSTVLTPSTSVRRFSHTGTRVSTSLQTKPGVMPETQTDTPLKPPTTYIGVDFALPPLEVLPTFKLKRDPKHKKVKKVRKVSTRAWKVVNPIATLSQKLTGE